MKEIKKEVQRVDYITYYEAWDGETFLTKKECEDYERSAASVLMRKLDDCTIAKDYSTEIFDCGDENQFKTIVPQYKVDIDTLNQLWFMFKGKDRLDAYFTYEDIGKPIVVGYRIYDAHYDWVWFYILPGVIDELTEGKFRLIKVEEDDKGEMDSRTQK